jgi:hypothetical protein
MSTDNEKLFSTFGRIHVILRREHGRIIDVEWAAANSEYALEIQKLARTSSNQELEELSEQIGLLHPLLKDGVKPVKAQGSKLPEAGETAKYTFSIR